MTGSEIDTDGSVASDITLTLLRLSLHCLVYTPADPLLPYVGLTVSNPVCHSYGSAFISRSNRLGKLN
jgi:hypothetical protein